MFYSFYLCVFYLDLYQGLGTYLFIYLFIYLF